MWVTLAGVFFLPRGEAQEAGAAQVDRRSVTFAPQ